MKALSRTVNRGFITRCLLVRRVKRSLEARARTASNHPFTMAGAVEFDSAVYTKRVSPGSAESSSQGLTLLTMTAAPLSTDQDLTSAIGLTLSDLLKMLEKRRRVESLAVCSGDHCNAHCHAHPTTEASV